MDMDSIGYKFLFYKPNTRRNIELPKRIAEIIPGVGESMKFVTTTITLVYTHP